MSLSKKIAITGAVAVTAFSSFVVAVPQAEATTRNGCPYPYVCVKDGKNGGGNVTGMFRDLTDNPFRYQYTRPRWVWSVVNARNDDAVLLRFRTRDGVTHYSCMHANEVKYSSGNLQLTGLLIKDENDC